MHRCPANSEKEIAGYIAVLPTARRQLQVTSPSANGQKTIAGDIVVLPISEKEIAGYIAVLPIGEKTTYKNITVPQILGR